MAQKKMASRTTKNVQLDMRACIFWVSLRQRRSNNKFRVSPRQMLEYDQQGSLHKCRHLIVSLEQLNSYQVRADLLGKKTNENLVQEQKLLHALILHKIRVPVTSPPKSRRTAEKVS
ncbi:hypothetical protein [Tropicibacter sp. Alg240-R139]|uniref:hypothetical protein n=1 Tax=Tropicibacter sp. Alg240-R139 TaxID=2305991 RepID=UPI0013DF1995|nr:hypothetical protein [Tropicibacter sp. Alg240-R139]